MLGKMILLVFLMTIVMVISSPTTFTTYQPPTELPDQCQLIAASGSEKPNQPFPDPTTAKPSTRVDYALAPSLEITSKDKSGGQPESESGNGSHQVVRKNRPLIHRFA